MKIRTDFVTNSSSSSYTEIVIENLVLLEILQRYKELGVFSYKNPSFLIGSYEPIAGDSHLEHYSLVTKTPAFAFYENMHGEGWTRVRGAPESLDDVVSNILSIMYEDGCLQMDQFEQMEEELQQRSYEIVDGYLYVNWSKEDLDPHISPGEESKWEFYFDPENGEKYIVGYREFREEDGDEI